jgi:hypothetical protein
MESNDRMHFQNDKEIEKLIPFELGTFSLKSDSLYRAHSLFRENSKGKQMELEARKNSCTYLQRHLPLQEKT